MSYARGEVWWGPAPHKSGPAYRPWVVVTGSSHPFAETECIALAMTTQRHNAGITVRDGDWLEGGANKQSYISPWYVTTIKHRDFDRHQGTLAESVVTEAVNQLHQHTTLSES
ncbi:MULTISPECIES: type II toxin-antitoxin system PemK/MazF family toxin [Salinibaculum]|uniref:type II toxin-antitoxin system PemK/MazF family toxin n=1 Tax=Salinibaculum TaxID=2732368 RepID=UPI0030CF5B86